MKNNRRAVPGITIIAVLLVVILLMNVLLSSFGDTLSSYLGDGATVISVVPAWEMAVFVANIVIAALLVVCLVLAIVESRRNNRTVIRVTSRKEEDET